MTGKRNRFGGNERKKGMGLYALIAIMILVLGLLFTVSMSNYSTYELVRQGETITLWKGKFIPKGSEPVQSFDTLDKAGCESLYFRSTLFIRRKHVKPNRAPPLRGPASPPGGPPAAAPRARRAAPGTLFRRP